MKISKERLQRESRDLFWMTVGFVAISEARFYWRCFREGWRAGKRERNLFPVSFDYDGIQAMCDKCEAKPTVCTVMDDQAETMHTTCAKHAPKVRADA